MRSVRANRSPTGRFWREASAVSPDFDGRRSVASFCEALQRRTWMWSSHRVSTVGRRLCNYCSFSSLLDLDLNCIRKSLQRRPSFIDVPESAWC